MKTLKFIASTLVFSLLLYSCNKNEFAPEIIDQEFTIEENSPSGTIIGAVEASDADEDQMISFEIIEGNLEDIFEIDPDNGILSIANPLKLDYEENIQFILKIAVADNHDKEPLESSAKVQINVTDENEFSPVMNNQGFDIDENPSNGQEIGTVQAQDADTHQTLSYSIIGNNENNYFQIDSLTGILSVKDSSGFDFESNQELTVLIQVEDDHVSPMTDTAYMTVNIQDALEITDGLIANYPFSGDANDISGNGINGQIFGASLTSDRYGNPNSAFSFDGIDDYIGLTNSEDLHFGNNDFSISLWYQLSSLEIKPQDVISIYNSTGNNREFRFASNPIQDSMYFQLFDNGTSSGNYIKFKTKLEWQHITITRSSNILKLYMNGTIFSEIPITANIVLTAAKPIIGAVDKSTNSPDAFFDGKIDDIYIHSRALEDWEIATLFQKK
ncbi:MAG: cadherin domain-containing protein [Bacteroidota bacterium]